MCSPRCTQNAIRDDLLARAQHHMYVAGKQNTMLGRLYWSASQTDGRVGRRPSVGTRVRTLTRFPASGCCSSVDRQRRTRVYVVSVGSVRMLASMLNSRQCPTEPTCSKNRRAPSAASDLIKVLFCSLNHVLQSVPIPVWYC